MPCYNRRPSKEKKKLCPFNSSFSIQHTSSLLLARQKPSLLTPSADNHRAVKNSFAQSKYTSENGANTAAAAAI
jgi:hypothetical protein